MREDFSKAEQVLRRLNGKNSNIQSQLDKMISTAETERAIIEQSKEASFLDCFRGAEWRRTRIILICNYLPQVVGGTLSANAPYFLSQTGLPSHTVVMLIQVGISFGVASSILNIFMMMKFGHRVLMLSGICLCTALFTVMGAAGCFKTHTALL
jgi:SP family general alpha glucoside:H+ symporter-like MFS transporter